VACSREPIRETCDDPQMSTTAPAPSPAFDPSRRLSPSAAAVLTFLSAACVLVLEIAAGRLLAPYIGVTLQTWTGIIGVILGGIALGAWAGGRAADRVGPETLIGPAFIAGGLAAMASVPIIGVVGPASRGLELPSVVLLAATGFFLLGLVPTRLLILATGALLVLIGAVVTAWLFRSRGAPLLAIIAAVVVAGATTAVPNPCERESRYYCMSVIVDRDYPAGRILVLDNLWHAFVDLEEPTRLQFGYIRWFAAAAEPLIETRGSDLEALHLGGGGFAFPRYLRAVAPGSSHRILEIDPAIIEIGRAELGLLLDDDLQVTLGDARISIEAQPTDGFDLIAGDAFGGLSVPWHLTTAEFLAEVDRVLRPDGRYVMNLIDRPALRFVRAEVATLRERFAHVVVLGLPSVIPTGHGGNVVLVASHVPLDVEQIRARSEELGETTRAIADRAELDAFVAGADVLRDDFAPVDQLIWE